MPIMIHVMILVICDLLQQRACPCCTELRYDVAAAVAPQAPSHATTTRPPTTNSRLPPSSILHSFTTAQSRIRRTRALSKWCPSVPSTKPRQPLTIQQDTIQQTARAVTSKPVQRAVVNTILVVTGAVSLFCIAGLATALFFQNYFPDQVLSAPVHLQYGYVSNPASHPPNYITNKLEQLWSQPIRNRISHHSCPEARFTAFTIRAYVPQRQSERCNAYRIALSSGFGFSSSRA